MSREPKQRRLRKSTDGWCPPKSAGKIVSMVEHRGELIIACERTVYKVRGGLVEPLNFKEVADDA